MFGTIAVLWDDGDRAECHVCGERFQHLGHHVWAAHDLTADEYRAIFGLASTTGLIGPALRKVRQADAIAREIWRNCPPVEWTPEQRRYFRRRHTLATEVKRRRGWRDAQRRKGQARRVERFCKVCGNGPLDNKRRTVTCSPKCSARALSAAATRPLTSRACRWCAQAFMPDQSHPKRTTCSDACSAELRRGLAAERGTQRRERGLVETACVVCGTPIRVNRWRLEHGLAGKTCSPQCARKLGASTRADRATATMCCVCGEIASPARRGRCHACHEFFRRHGVDAVIDTSAGRRRRLPSAEPDVEVTVSAIAATMDAPSVTARTEPCVECQVRDRQIAHLKSLAAGLRVELHYYRQRFESGVEREAMAPTRQRPRKKVERQPREATPEPAEVQVRGEELTELEAERPRDTALIPVLRCIVVQLGGSLADGRDVDGHLVVDGEIVD